VGVYYVIANLDEREYKTGTSLGVSTKFEDLLGGPLPELLSWLLVSGAPYRDKPVLRGSWASDRVIVAGDEGPSEAIWEQAKREFRDITEVTLETMAKDCSFFLLKYSEQGLVDDDGKLVRR
jgi:hypothetical protein